jgi:parvulin-like peptidyl-prolyl isomerase
MTKLRFLFLPALVFALAGLLLTGCGGGGDESVPADAVAEVDGEPIAVADFEGVLNQARQSYKNQKREFPKAGSQEYQTLKNQAVQFLVQRRQFEQAAAEMGIEVTDQQVEDRLAQIKKQYFGGDQKKYEKQLKEQGLTDAQVRADVRSQIVSEKISAEVTKGLKVTDKEIAAYYAKNKKQYEQPESRDVRHILVKTKKQADALHAQLQEGADFAALAKKHSTDTASKESGGKLTITRGQTVAAFDKKAFELKKDEISGPVKTEFGYHLIQALSAVKAATTTPLKDVREAIRGQLLQEKKNEAMTKWVDELKADYEDKVSYAVGYSPPATATGTTETDAEEE